MDLGCAVLGHTVLQNVHYRRNKAEQKIKLGVKAGKMVTRRSFVPNEVIHHERRLVSKGWGSKTLLLIERAVGVTSALLIDSPTQKLDSNDGVGGDVRPGFDSQQVHQGT